MPPVKIIYPKPTRTGHFGNSGLTTGGGILVWKTPDGELQLDPVGLGGRVCRSARLSIPADQADLVAATILAMKDA